MYMSDLVSWLITILIRGKELRPYNVGSSQGLPLRDVAALVAETSGSRTLTCETTHAPIATPAADYYVPATERARDELTVAESISLSLAIRKTLAYHDSEGRPGVMG